MKKSLGRRKLPFKFILSAFLMICHTSVSLDDDVSMMLQYEIYPQGSKEGYIDLTLMGKEKDLVGKLGAWLGG